MGDRELRSPGLGTVLEVLVAEGSAVEVGDEILVIESMKMEIPVVTVTAGTVRTIHVAVGAQVGEQELLVTLS